MRYLCVLYLVLFERLRNVSLFNTFKLFILSFLDKIVAYWDQGSCGEKGSDFNWEWCDKDGGGGCLSEVYQTKWQCPSGIVTLKEVHGDQYATSFSDEYRLDGCNYAYYAEYTCKSNGKLCTDIQERYYP